MESDAKLVIEMMNTDKVTKAVVKEIISFLNYKDLSNSTECEHIKSKLLDLFEYELDMIEQAPNGVHPMYRLSTY